MTILTHQHQFQIPISKIRHFLSHLFGSKYKYVANEFIEWL